MAKKKDLEAVGDVLAGTVEGLARDHFEREKAAYEERTGEKVEFVPPMPLTRTPIKGKSVESGESIGTDETGKAQGDE